MSEQATCKVCRKKHGPLAGRGHVRIPGGGLAPVPAQNWQARALKAEERVREEQAAREAAEERVRHLTEAAENALATMGYLIEGGDFSMPDDTARQLEGARDDLRAALSTPDRASQPEAQAAYDAQLREHIANGSWERQSQRCDCGAADYNGSLAEGMKRMPHALNCSERASQPEGQ